ncbi:CYFA0S24e00144g1_1 [Cyberlindnera fabianii]|uniref:CYFA0S24e00144g1_1 n=1 Tax=Cyberlindnera fabianii TaxID=36022 RepID=A0A061BFB2_CYBFA|nr:CYFA0S24e00144g1_1 [Cyberlindnera fabianii]
MPSVTPLGIPPLPGSNTEPTAMKHMVIVGLGMVGFAFLEKMLGDDTNNEFYYTIVGEEPVLAYNRVGLTEYFEHKQFDKLLLSPSTFYEGRNKERWDYSADEAVLKVDRAGKSVITSKNRVLYYDKLVFATGSSALLPLDILPLPINGGSKDDVRNYRDMGCFVYRTIEDLNKMLEFSTQLTTEKKHAVVVGGGLLGLEAGKALLDMEVFDKVTVVHRSHWLLSQQMDEKGGKLLTDKVRSLGVCARTGTTVQDLTFDDTGKLKSVIYSNGEVEDCQLLCYTIGIKPRDEVAKDCGLKCSQRGGIAIDNFLATSDPEIFAIGECASWNDKTFGLIAPGITMADILCFNLLQARYHSPKEFTEPDIGTRLKLMGVDVASFGDYFADRNGPKWLPRGDKNPVKALVYEDPIGGRYTKLILTGDGKYLLGGILVGDTKQFTSFTSLAKQRKPLAKTAADLILGKQDGEEDIGALSDDTQVCSCQNVNKGTLVAKIRDGTCSSLGELKSVTKAGTSCGGCEPTMKAIFEGEMKKMGKQLSNALCIHFKESRADLFSIVMVKQYKTFTEVMDNHGLIPGAAGCEICKPTIASILGTLRGRHILESDLHGLQDTNDRYLGNIQRNGTYSVVPRMSAGEITPEKLIAIGQIAKKYDLYTKITGGQRIDLFGALKQDLPKIWEELYSHGFESGQAYGKTLRNVKSCVSMWCRYGLGDATGFAIRLEERYKGIRSPHKMKGGVSGCVRDCAEFHAKDFGLCAVQNGYSVYVGGNGGMKPAHAQLLKADVPPDQVIPLIDRYLMFYFRTADRLQRTARWLETLDGGIEYLRDVVVHDKLGICKDLEDQMNELVGHYFDEWAAASVEKRQDDNKIFKQFVNTDVEQETVEIIRERGQRRPAEWPVNDKVERPDFKGVKWSSTSWRKVCDSSDLPVKEAGSSTTILVSDTQIALFRLKETLYACQNMCGHKRAFVLSQGILATDENNEVYVSCPLHKRNYVIDGESEKAGSCRNDATQSVTVFESKEEDGAIWLKLPSDEELDEVLGTTKWKVRSHESEGEGRAMFKKIDEKFKIKVPMRKAIAASGDLDW